MNTISTFSYWCLKNRVIQKKKLRATYFSNLPIEPDVSIIAMMTALDAVCDLLPRLVAQIIRRDAVDARPAACALRLMLLEHGSFLVDVGLDAFLADVVEDDLLRLSMSFFGFGLQDWAAPVLEQHLSMLLEIHFRFIMSIPGLVARAFALARSRCGGPSDAEHVADLAVAVSLADMLALVVVVTKRNSSRLRIGTLMISFSVGQDDVLLRYQVRQASLQTASRTFCW